MPILKPFRSKIFELQVDTGDWVRNFGQDGEQYIRAVHTDPTVGDDTANEVVALVLDKSPVNEFTELSLTFEWSVNGADNNFTHITISFSVQVDVETYLDLLERVNDHFRQVSNALERIAEEGSQEALLLPKVRSSFTKKISTLRNVQGMGDTPT